MFYIWLRTFLYFFPGVLRCSVVTPLKRNSGNEINYIFFGAKNCTREWERSTKTSWREPKCHSRQLCLLRADFAGEKHLFYQWGIRGEVYEIEVKIMKIRKVAGLSPLQNCKTQLVKGKRNQQVLGPQLWKTNQILKFWRAENEDQYFQL